MYEATTWCAPSRRCPSPPTVSIEEPDMTEHAFADRHISLTADDHAKMLAGLGFATASDLLEEAVPDNIQVDSPIQVPAALTETEALAALRTYADRNQVFTSLIGQGWNDTITPAVIRRNMIENPAWYTAYTPYQPEISQGRLEMLLVFQTMIADLTGCELANASLLDESTAAAEAMTMLRRLDRTKRTGFFVDADCHPQTIAVCRTRAEPLGIEITVGDPTTDLVPEAVYGALLAQPGSSGAITDLPPIIEALHGAKATAAVTTDLFYCTLGISPGEAGADVVVGSAQRFGVPMGFGGPHAGFMATKERHARSLPGRLVGVSIDSHGDPAYRLALQTREQHIRRDKATSNICTAQALLANVAAAYACWHGPDGLKAIAERIRGYAATFQASMAAAGRDVTEHFFDTVTVTGPADEWVAAAAAKRINIRRLNDSQISVSFDETTTDSTVAELLGAWGVEVVPASGSGLPDAMVRTSPYLTDERFHRFQSEHEMLRWLRRLADRDLALDRTMIPLGSCTMKLNAAAEMEPITWPEFATIHPFAPADQTAGYIDLINDLEADLAAITGYDAISLQPNAGSQGEYAGLLAISGWQEARGEGHRNVCLIPQSAHGTNAASAVMAGMRVVVVACNERGDIDLDDLKLKIENHRDDLAALMITYPSTHGVYEHTVAEVCDLVHEAGGQVYTDGANLNALVGVAQPGSFGSDVSHLNLHKTFCIPHGGGGPGVGPIGVGEHLIPFLPQVELAGEDDVQRRVSGAAYGSAGILPISWMYIRLMGPEGLRRATEGAVLAANYVASRLREHYPILYTGPGGLVAHECIIDIRPLHDSTGIDVDDIAKRLADYGFHAPTMSFPVAGTLMIEPTESESLAELDRFCAAMIGIATEVSQIASGDVELDASVLRAAPHTAADVTVDEWSRSYSRAEAAFPLPGMAADKYFPPVGRIDNAHGDRNLQCSCPPLDAFSE
ncbi:MAG: aminomethyl-transferring glycine dehydrogenase [Acidimicrobiales bacterium]|nr:aminomethyl-transferring glycine dehydrogenase [Acidimicrobiales bacterium]